MSNFTLEARLDTKDPFVLEFLGPPSAVVHKITGKLVMNVTKPIQLKQLTVAFLGQAFLTFSKAVLTLKSEPLNIDRVEHNILTSPTHYTPGEYTFAFQLDLPGDIATTDSSKLPSASNISWEYLLVSSAIPVGLMARRKEFKKKLELRRVQVEQSSTADWQFGAKREGQIDCSIYTPKFVTLGQQGRVKISLYMHAYSSQYRVKEILVGAVQSEWIEFDVDTHDPQKRGKRFVVPNKDAYLSMGIQQRQSSIAHFFNSKMIARPISIVNPDQETFTTAWGRETPIECELTLSTNDISPSEFCTWMKIGHMTHLTIVFADPSIKPMIVKPPFTVGRVLEDPWAHHSLRALDNEHEHDDHHSSSNAALPGYGEGIEYTTLLDSNTHRVDHSALYRELYPERSELAVPDVTDELPPTYESEVEVRPEFSSGKR
ncbi:hypothetical protein BGX29_008038 [Mortierella sp. GBA35]|nr:hypothetical protein BGX29_008038 [Mortierella sp. GBA35]